MKDRAKAVCAALSFGLVGLGAACFLGGGNKASHATTDLPALRVELKKQVAKGRLTEAEAQVRLAEAIAEGHRKDRAKVKAESLSELQALGAQLKAQVAKGELTEQAAKAAFIEAKTKLLAGAGEKKQPDSGISK